MVTRERNNSIPKMFLQFFPFFLATIAPTYALRGRLRKSWMKNIMEWTKLNFEQCIRRAEDRDYGRGVTTNLLT